MVQFDADHYEIVLGYNGSTLQQSHLISVEGGAGEGVLMHFTSTGDGAVQVDSPTRALGFFPLESPSDMVLSDFSDL